MGVCNVQALGVRQQNIIPDFPRPMRLRCTFQHASLQSFNGTRQSQCAVLNASKLYVETCEDRLGLPAACGRVAARALRAAGQQVCSLGNSRAMMEREGAGKRRGV